MIYKDEIIIPDPISEDIVWAIYKEYIILLDTLGIYDMKTDVFNYRRLAYGMAIFVPIFTTMFLLACQSLIFIIISLQ